MGWGTPIRDEESAKDPAKRRDKEPSSSREEEESDVLEAERGRFGNEGWGQLLIDVVPTHHTVARPLRGSLLLLSIPEIRSGR